MSKPLPPTGISTASYSNSIIVKWRSSSSSNIRGYNIYNSQTSGGGISGYIKLNDELIQIVAETSSETVSYSENIVETNSVRTTTLVENLEIISYYSFTHFNLKENKEQFYVMTAVNTDGEESLYSNEISDTPIIIDISLVNINRRSKSDVNLAYLDSILSHNQKIDVKPATLTTDLFVDPAGIEFETAYILISYFNTASSFVTLKLFDDANVDRISDSVASFIPKQDLRRALGYNTDGSEDYLVQIFIDSSFDRLAANAFTTRLGATKAKGRAIFYTTNPPTTDITIDAGEIISTLTGQNSPATNFQTLSSITFVAKNKDLYFNKTQQRYELQVDIEAVDAGTNGNKTANTIINTKRTGWLVTNPFSTYGGKEKESNADLADRAILAFGPLDVGTLNGYERTMKNSLNVEDVIVIDAGDVLMQRDYDDVRNKHVFGKVDIYFQGEELEEFTEDIGFLYEEVQNETFSIIQLNTSLDNLLIESTNPLVTTLKPIFQVDQIRNITNGYDYDIFGNIMIYVNGTPQIKGRFNDVEINLTTGEVVFAQPLGVGLLVTANYDAYVTNEITISSAAGGETTATLNQLNNGIREESYTVYKNDALLTEITDYTLVLSTGVITFINPLSTADQIKTNYAFITIGEILESSTIGGERSFTVTNIPIYPSVSYLDNQIYINRFNTINSALITIITDVIRVNYRYRNSNPIILSHQPVQSIASITGSTSGLLTEGTHYVFNRIDDILLQGNSVEAQRGFSINYNPLDQLPSGSLNSYSETLVMAGVEEVSLFFKGIDIDTILVQNTARTITYIKNIDYIVTDYGLSEYVTVKRINAGSIINGQSVLFDYKYGEVLTVKYSVNNLVKKLQDIINETKHITADVLVKESPITKVNIKVSVVLHPLVDKSLIKNAIISKISDEITNKKMGNNLFRSDIIRAIDSTDGVDYVILPITTMTKADDTMIIREEIDKNQITWIELPTTTKSWITSLKWVNENPTSNGTFTITPLHNQIVNVTATVLNKTTNETYTVSSFTSNTILLSGIVSPLSTDILELNYYTRIGALQYPTGGNASDDTLPFGIFINDVALTLVDTESAVDSDYDQGIIAPDGALIISNLSDPNGVNTNVTYFVQNQVGDNDIMISSIEHLEIGSLDVFVS
jgi:hypothetical protein